MGKTWISLFPDPLLASHLDRFPRQPDMAVLALHSKCAIVPVILIMASYTAGSQNHFCFYRCFVTIDTLQRLVLSVQLEFGFIMIEIPAFPITGVVA